MNANEELEVPARICVLLTALAFCLCVLYCGVEPVPAAPPAAADTTAADTCTAPACYPDPGFPPI